MEHKGLAEKLATHSLLGQVFSATEIENIIKTNQIREFSAGDHLLKQEQDSSVLCIIISGEATLMDAHSPDLTDSMGKLHPFRIANLQAVLRKRAYDYSIKAAINSQALFLPTRLVMEKLDKNPDLKNYLLFISENVEARKISKEMDEANCSQAFKVALLGRSKLVDWPASSWLKTMEKPADFAFYLIQGAIQVYRSANQKKARVWEGSEKTWYLWKEVLAGSAQSSTAIKAIESLKIISLSSTDLKILATEFPADFTKFQDWSFSGKTSTPHEKDEAESEIDDLSDLFPKEVFERNKKGLGYPFVRQNDIMDCGPACLTMVSKYYGIETTIQFWRERLSTDKSGTSLFDLAHSAERSGFIAHGMMIEDLSSLETEFFPIIALRKYHYMVIYKIEGTNLIVGDPGIGIRRISIQEFSADFEGYCLLLKPTERAFSLKAPSSKYGHYLDLLSGFKKEVAMILASSFILVVLGSFFPILSQIIVDEVLETKNTGYLFGIIAVAIIVAAAQSSLSWIRSFYISFLSARVDFRSQAGFVNKLFSLPYKFFASRHIGDFTRRMSELNEIRLFFTRELIGVLLDACTVIIYLAALFIYHPLVGLAVMLAAPFVLLVSVLVSRSLVQRYSDYFEKFANHEGLTTDLLNGILSIKANVAETGMRWRFEESKIQALKARYNYELFSAKLWNFSDFIEQGIRFSIIGLAAYMGIRSELSPGQIVAISILTERALAPFRSLSHSWSEMVRIKTVLDRLNDVFLSQSEVSRDQAGITKSALKGEIEFRDVWFRYGGESSDWALRGVSFKIKPGETIAIVGPSGSGKSTVAMLLMRFFEPTKGQILVDGRDHRDFDLVWLRTQLGYVGQEVHLFGGALFENIALGDPEPNLVQVQSAAELADAHKMIQEKSSGYNHYIPHGGHGLSGGEKQKIAIARSLYNQPNVFLIDEASSGLDGISEKQLLQNLHQASKGKTIIHIAHRIRPVLSAQRIYVLSGGRVVEQGTLESLIEAKGVFSEMFDDHITPEIPKTKGAA